MTLMSGAMLGFMDKGIEFDAISTSGPGALVGLLAIAPNRKSPREALEDLPNLYTGDLFHKLPRVRELVELLRNYLEILKPGFKASDVLQPGAY
jgi:hypothetical protein